MALFFDAAWFDARLKTLGLSRSDLGTALGLNEAELADVWKDQRELKASDVRILAALLASPPAEIADHAGVSTPVPKGEDATAAILQRLEQIEKTLAELKVLVSAIDRSLHRNA